MSTITFPLLLQAGNIRGSHGTHTLLVADKDGIIRHIGRGASGLSAAAASIRELLTVKPPAISLPSRSLDVGQNVPAGESRTVALVVKNTGGEDLSITNMESDFEGVTFSLTELTVAPGDSATVDITFTPAEGGPFSGTITISSDDPENSSVTVSFSGTAAIIKPPTISIANTSLNFGEDVPAGESKTVTLVVKNTGEKDLSITNVESDLEGVTFSLTELMVAPGDSATVDITLTPAEGGPFSGTITISSDDPENSSVTVAISGTAIVVPINARADFDGSGEIDFGDFIAFAQAFGTENATFDLDGSGLVDFGDFLEFAKNFGKRVP